MLSKVEVPGDLLDGLDLPYSCTKGKTSPSSRPTKHFACACSLVNIIHLAQACIVRCCKVSLACFLQPL